MTNINKLDVNELKLSVANVSTLNKDTKCLKEDVMLCLEILTKEVVKNQDFLCCLKKEWIDNQSDSDDRDKTSEQNSSMNENMQSQTLVSNFITENPSISQKTNYICQEHKKGMCSHGYKETNCKDLHPQLCSKYIKNGLFMCGCS